MNGSSILKKVLPVILSIVLIIALFGVTSAIKAGGNYYPSVTDPDGDYIKISDGVSISRQEMYEELKAGIGLSSIINIANKEILTQEKNADGVSFFEAVDDADIDKEIEIATFGEDADLELVEDKEEKIQDFKNLMLTGYGYKTDDEIRDHYRLVLAKEAYAKSLLEKDVDDEDNDLYIKDEDIEDKYEDNYSKSYYAFIIPFTSEEQAKMALQQLGVGIKNKKWIHLTLEEVKEGSGIYETKEGDFLTTSEVIETFMKLYDLVYGYKAEEYKEGTYEINDGKVTVKDGDYALVDASEKIAAILALAEEVKALLEAEPADNEGAKAKLAEVENLLKEIAELVVFADGIKPIQTNIDELKTTLEGSAEGSDPLKGIDELIKLVKAFDSKKYLFDSSAEGKLFYAYKDLNEYDSKLPSQFKNNYTEYVPFTDGDNKVSENTSADAQSWYSASVVSGTNVKYFVLKVKEVAAPKLEDVKDEIKAELIDAKLSSDYVEEKMAELRAKYEFKVFDSKLEAKYIEAISEYEDTEYDKTSKKEDNKVVVSYKVDGNVKEVTADDLFAYMDKISGVATALSELSFERLLNDKELNKYYDVTTGEWLGEEGEELRENIILSIENQRLYFLAGAYSSYGYDPSTMTWEEFLTDVNGAKDEKDLAFINLYSEIMGDYVKEALKYILVDGEANEIDYMTSLEEATNSKVWSIISERMNDVLAEKFTVNGIHLLVCAYETVNDAANASDKDSKVTPLDPKKWTDEQKQLAKELIEDVYFYLQCAEGTYASKLEAVVNAFKAAPYAHEVDGKYVDVINTSGEKYKYYLEAAEAKIDLAKYKSAGLSLKYESLGTFSNGSMVDSFNDAAKSIWDQDMKDKEYNRVTVYRHETDGAAIETTYGYHLYVNLSSTPNTEFDSVSAEGAEAVKSVLPSLYEIRLYALHQALEAADTSELSEEELEKFEAYEEKIHELITDEMKSAYETYAKSIIDQLVGTSFAAIVQQQDLVDLLEGVTINSPSGLTLEDIKKVVEINKESIYEETLTALKAGDEKLND